MTKFTRDMILGMAYGCILVGCGVVGWRFLVVLFAGWLVITIKSYADE
jgi:hypothetical protein